MTSATTSAHTPGQTSGPTAAPHSAAAPSSFDPSHHPRLSTLALFGGTPVSRETIPLISIRMGDAEVDGVVQVLRSGRLAQGAVVKEFEAAFAAQTGAKHAIAASNGTTALQLVYQILLKANESAITPAWTFIATASMVRARPARPIFADVREDTFNIDLGSVEQRRLAHVASTGRSDTRVLVPVHLYGNCADIDCIDAYAAQHDMKVVYDAAQSHLATYRGKPIGAFGAAVTYSFYPTKNMTTGEGGMITTNDDALADELRVVRDHGMRIRYLHETLGFNYRMTDIFAAIGLAQLRDLPERTAKRQANAAMLDRLLAGVPAVHTPVASPQSTHVYHLYTLRLVLEQLVGTRDDFIKALNAEGVATAIHYPRPLHRQPVFMKDPELDCSPHPVSDRLADSVLSIPVQPDLTEPQVGQVAEAVAKVARAMGR